MKNRNLIRHFVWIAVLPLLLSQLFVGCSATHTTKGGAIGAGVGGALGGIIGHQSDNTVVGAIIGAAVGGTAGALIGRHMDKQAEELRDDLKNATVERVGEGILITFDSGLLFELNSFALQQATKNNLKSLGKTLTKYDDTDILIEGHTDDTGEASYNNSLSERRAKAVADHLVGQQVPASRMTTKGYGEGQPIQSNDTEVGRQANRRVEVAIYANKKMKRMAENGTLQ